MPSIRRHSTFLAITNSVPPVSTLLKACKTCRQLQQVHSQIVRKGLEQDHFLMAQFLCLSQRLSTLFYFTTVFNCILSPTTFIWNALIRAYSAKSCFSDTFSAFIRMNRDGGSPDRYTFPPLIKACATANKIREGRSIHASTIRCGVEWDVFVSTSLVDLYGKCEDIECARKVFDGMSERNVVSWTAMVVGYVIAGDLVEAKRLFNEIPERNVASWNAIIGGFVKLGDLNSARRFFDEMPEKDVVSFTTMIDGYAKAGDMVSARFLFDQAPGIDIVAWSALISGYTGNGEPAEALNIFYEMEKRNVRPDEYIMVSLMAACSQIGSLKYSKWVDNYVTENSIIHGPHVYAALVDMNAKCGNMERALYLFEQMPRRDLFTYCSMIQGLSIHGRGEQAISLFDRMLNEGLTPDEVAFTVILTACSTSGLVEEGWHFFESVQNKYGIVPSSDHYACMVDLLSRSGHLKSAYELLKSMPVEPHAGAWGALLGACKIHCDMELGKLVAARLFELEPQNGGNYVLLSNIYAAKGNWMDVSVVRDKMKERGIKKIPGLSRI